MELCFNTKISLLALVKNCNYCVAPECIHTLDLFQRLLWFEFLHHTGNSWPVIIHTLRVGMDIL